MKVSSSIRAELNLPLIVYYRDVPSVINEDYHGLSDLLLAENAVASRHFRSANCAIEPRFHFYGYDTTRRDRDNSLIHALRHVRHDVRTRAGGQSE